MKIGAVRQTWETRIVETRKPDIKLESKYRENIVENRQNNKRIKNIGRYKKMGKCGA